MNDAQAEILRLYHTGEITVTECWERLAGIQAKRSGREIVLTKPPSKVYEKLNEHELEAILTLQSVSFGGGREGKRFVSQVKDMTEMTARQREYLRALVWRYRRQIWEPKRANMLAQDCLNKMGRDSTDVQSA